MLTATGSEREARECPCAQPHFRLLALTQPHVKVAPAPTPRRGRWIDEQQKRDIPARLAILAMVVGLTPVFAFWLDWRLGVFVVAAFAALAFGVWRVSNER